ncbi:MAG: P-loop NTPase [Proteobacteria bacterium]|nr:(4Fe-4S)-binding protein [Desulfobacula sp.]MBU3953068.1 P-loop NTPase [Pseudomonadota bacterium]MBU4132352.1 P-loop NTPase [Pseudomonadota bacterium]
MKELVILSGKGGTGKTSLTAAFAGLSQNMMLCDTDVDAADLHLLMAPEIKETFDFVGGNQAIIDPEKCVACGLCKALCRFNAVIEHTNPLSFTIDGIDCEGCGVCVDLCPEKAIDFPRKTCGQWFVSDTRFGPMIHARLGIAEENSGRLVALIREETRNRVRKQHLNLILTDGPPGIGCPVIASMGQANCILIVAEPTVSGIHDMKRVAQLAAHFKIPAMVCVNKFDLNPDQGLAIEQIARDNNIRSVGRIPFDPNFTQAMIQGKTILETHENSDASQAIRKIWQTIMENPVMKQERIM